MAASHCWAACTEQYTNCRVSTVFQGCCPSHSSSLHGCPPITTHGQCSSYGGLRAARRERSVAMVVLGGIRRGFGQDGCTMDRRKESVIRPSAENNKKKAGGISFGDQLLDYIEGGPKLRKWYGAPDQLPKDGGSKKEQKPEEPVDEDDDEEDLVRDVVLVTDGDGETGQLVVLELILRRSRVRALVKDIKAATVGFGAYVEPVEGDVNDKEILKGVMRGVRAVICPSKVGKLADRELLKGVKHVVLLSKRKDSNAMEISQLNEGVIKGVQLAVNRNQGGLGALFGGLGRRDAEDNEAAVASLGVPYTIIRVGSLKDEEGGQRGFRYGQDGDVKGTICREDAAFVCVEALDSPPQKALVFEVVNGKEEVEDWSAVFTSLKETTAASGS